MAVSLRDLKQRRESVASMMKITRAMELIASSQVNRAQTKAQAAAEYTAELHRAVSAVATFSDVEHKLVQEPTNPTRAGVLVISSDRGLSGGYPSAVTRATEGLINHLRGLGREIDIFTSGRKAREYFDYRDIPVVQDWMGFSDDPRYEHAREIGEQLVAHFMTDESAGGVSELYVVYTEFISLVRNEVHITRLLPLEVVDEVATIEESDHHVPEYNFEPSAEAVLDALLPMYIIDMIKFMLRNASASELASRQQAMHAATDNAKDLIRDLTREMNAARQAAITQEITEIVGGASALAES